MKEIYRGYELHANREKSLGGDMLLYYFIVRESDGYIPVDSFDYSDNEAEMIGMLRKDVDEELAKDDPWGEKYEREEREKRSKR